MTFPHSPSFADIIIHFTYHHPNSKNQAKNRTFCVILYIKQKMRKYTLFTHFYFDSFFLIGVFPDGTLALEICQAFVLSVSAFFLDNTEDK